MNTIFNMTNQYRASKGLNRLSWNDTLAYTARIKAQDICDNNYWSHTRPDGEEFHVLIGKSYPYERAGENLARGFQTDQATMQGWKNSPSHNSNMLDSWQHLGTATVSCKGESISVQHFGIPKSQALELPQPRQTERTETPETPPVTEENLEGIITGARIHSELESYTPPSQSYMWITIPILLLILCVILYKIINMRNRS